jgi:uncharacterized membrane protein YcaP (DUF421 family)
MLDFSDLFQITVSPVEIIVRGTVIYWFLFLLFRFVLRRDVGSVGIADVLLLVLIADASQNAMAGGYESVTDGVILVATIAFWNYFLDWASYHSSAVRKFVEPQPLLVIRNGQLMRRNMRRELLGKDELMAQLREQGIEDFSEVKEARMEGDGQISVIKKDAKPGDAQPPKGSPAP